MTLISHPTMTGKYKRGERSMFNFNDSFRVISPLRIFAFKIALLEGLCSIARSSRTKYLYIKNALCPRIQNPLALTSGCASSSVFAVLYLSNTPVKGYKGGSIVTSLQTSASRSPVRSLRDQNGYNFQKPSFDRGVAPPPAETKNNLRKFEA